MMLNQVKIFEIILFIYYKCKGSITLDGVDIRELDPKWYRKNIGFVSQEPILFSGFFLIIKNIF